MAERLLGAAVLAAIRWLMFAVPYAFVYVFPQPLQVAFFFAIMISMIVYILDWLVDKRRG
jgi:hypothetical protein